MHFIVKTPKQVHMQNFSQIGEVPWPTRTQILWSMPLKNCFEDTTAEEEKLFAIDVANSTEVLDFLAKVYSPPKECTQLYEKCSEISRDCDDKGRLADSLNSVGFRHLSSCDAAHLRVDHKILHIFQEAHDLRMTLPEDKQECQTHAHTISKLGFCYFLKVTLFYV